jgi:hypothetical protein
MLWFMPSSTVTFWLLPAWPGLEFIGSVIYSLLNGINFLYASEASRSKVKKKTEEKDKKRRKL